MPRIRTFVLAGIALVLLAACMPIQYGGDTSKITLVSSTTTGGWKYDYYRNTAYPCAVSGYQTFVVGTKVGSSDTTAAPLWVFMHGGGAGYFDASGNPIPSKGQKVEESAASSTTYLTNNGLLGLVRSDPANFRTVAVSYCSHDVYAGTNSPDPHNPNTTPDGNPRTTNGVYEVKAAVQFVQSKYPTTKFFLHGTSVGSAGAYGVAWAMQQQAGLRPAGVVGDASIINAEAFAAGYAAGYCTDDNDPARVAAIAARVDPDLANIDNEPDKLVSSGRLTVPVLHIWNHGDSNTCGSPQISCPLRDGSHVMMGLTDCIHEPMREAIVGRGTEQQVEELPGVRRQRRNA